MPMPIINSDATASHNVECITSGATTPATTPLAVDPTNAYKDDAMPRRCG